MIATMAGVAAAEDAPKEKVIFEENFSDAPGNGWSWLRESKGDWKIDKERKELLLRSMWATGGLNNMLLRTAPDGKKVAIEVHIQHETPVDFEFSGLIWYFDDKNSMGLVQERWDDGTWHVFMGRRKADSKSQVLKHAIYDKPEIDLRMVVTGSKAKGFYRAPGTSNWQSVGEMEMPSSGAAKVGLRTGSAERDKPSWARFSKFRILQLSD
jgi:hypothetical protein